MAVTAGKESSPMPPKAVEVPPDLSFYRGLLAKSRLLIGFAILGSFIAALALVLYGFIAVFQVIWHGYVHTRIDVDGAKYLAVEFVEMIDIFFLGTVLYIVAFGLYQLFVEPDLPVPAWLRVRDIDALKEKLIGSVIVLMAVSFLTFVVDWDGSSRIIYLGAATALVILALAIVQYVSATTHQTVHAEPDQDHHPPAVEEQRGPTNPT